MAKLFNKKSVYANLKQVPKKTTLSKVKVSSKAQKNAKKKAKKKTGK